MPVIDFKTHKNNGAIAIFRKVLTIGAVLNGGGMSALGAVTQQNDTIVNELSEVTIEAKREIHTTDADILFLSDKNKEFGTNALDAISSLRQFSPVLDGTDLKTAGQKDVFILINGRPSSAQELRGYTGKEIKKVTYYPLAPTRFSDYTDGPLVDVEVKVDKNYIHTFFSASNSINAGYGTDQAMVRWADSLNLVRADYFIDYRDLKYDNRDTYIYPVSPSLNRSYHTESGLRGNYQRGSLSWQHTADRKLFYLSAALAHNPGCRRYTEVDDGKEETPDAAEAYSRSLRSLTDQGCLNFYFTKESAGRWLEIQATGSVGKTSSENYLGPESHRTDATEFSSRSYMGYASIMYYIPGKVNIFLIGSTSYLHADNRQTLPETFRYGSDNDNINLATELSGKFAGGSRTLGYSVGLNINRDHVRTRHFGVDRADWLVRPRLTLSATLSEKLFMRLRANISSGIPSVAQLSDVPTFQESNLVWAGNPDLKGWTTYTVRLMPQYTPFPGKFSVNGEINYKYISNPVRSCVAEGSLVEIRYMNLRYEKDVEAQLFMSITPHRNFSINPYSQWTYSGYRTPGRLVSRGYFRYGGSLYYNTRRVQAVAHVNAPYKLFKGDITEYGGWQLSCSVLVKLPAGLSASLKWNRSYQGDRTSISSTGILDYVSASRIPRLANQIMLGLTWSFSYGVYRKRQEADVNEVSHDEGISSFNKVKM